MCRKLGGDDCPSCPWISPLSHAHPRPPLQTHTQPPEESGLPHWLTAEPPGTTASCPSRPCCAELWLVGRWPPLTLLTFPPSSPSVPARADLILQENQGALIGGRMGLAGLHARLCCAQRLPVLESTLGSDAYPARQPSPAPPTRGTSCCDC